MIEVRVEKVRHLTLLRFLPSFEDAKMVKISGFLEADIAVYHVGVKSSAKRPIATVMGLREDQQAFKLRP